MDITTVCRQFISDRILSSLPLGNGHINDTFLVKTDRSQYVLQRIRPQMDVEKLSHNYRLYSEACLNAGWLFPTFLNTRENDKYHTDGEGFHWRMYPYIDGDTLSAPLSSEALFACGQGIAKMHAILNNLNGAPKAVYPVLHDLSHYYAEFKELLAGDNLLVQERDSVAEEIIERRIDEFVKPASAVSSIVHGDAKLDNILFRNGQVVGFLDYDTVMPGLPAEDVADCIRSCCLRNGVYDRDAAAILIDGYSSINNSLTSDEIQSAFRKICFELGLRYYTDAISKEKKFKVHYPGYRLGKAKTLLAIADQ